MAKPSSIGDNATTRSSPELSLKVVANRRRHTAVVATVFLVGVVRHNIVAEQQCRIMQNFDAQLTWEWAAVVVKRDGELLVRGVGGSE